MSTTSNTYSSQGTNATDNTKTYVQQAYEGAASLASTAATTVQNALNNTGMTGTADPSTQYRNNQAHVGGVGDLGTTSEADVTRLPEERANPEPLSSAGTTDISMSNPAISDPASFQARLNAREPPVPYPETGSGVGQLQFRNQQPHVGGVGDMGTASEADVARLPEERANPDPLASKPGAATITTAKAKSGLTSAKDGLKGTVHDVTASGHSGGMTGSNHDTDHGLGMPHREGREYGGRDEGALGDDANAVPGASNLGAGAYQDSQKTDGLETAAGRPMDQPESHDAQDEATSGSPTIPSKMDKLKGKFHIMKGKLTKDEEEIEQGKRKATTGDLVS